MESMWGDQEREQGPKKKKTEIAEEEEEWAGNGDAADARHEDWGDETGDFDADVEWVDFDDGKNNSSDENNSEVTDDFRPVKRRKLLKQKESFNEFETVLSLVNDPSTQCLNLKTCNIKLGYADIEKLAAELRTNTTLKEITVDAAKLSLVEFRDEKTRELDLQGKGYGAKEAIIIASLLAKNARLTTLDLSNNCIGDAGVEPLVKALAGNTALKMLDVRINNISGGSAASGLARAVLNHATLESFGCIPFRELQTNDSKLTSLSLSECGPVEAIVLCEALKKNTSLVNLVFVNNTRNHAWQKTMSAMVQLNKNEIEQLNLNDNVILHSEHAAFIAYKLKRNQRLQVLNVSNNCIGNRGVMCFVEALQENNRVKMLDFSFNSTSYNCDNLIGLLTASATVTSLNLSGNDFSLLRGSLMPQTNFDQSDQANAQDGSIRDGAKRLEDVIMGNKTLQNLTINGEIPINLLRDEKTTSLDLSNRGYREEDIFIIAALLKMNTTITMLDLVNNSIGCEGANTLWEALKVNESVTSLSIRGNNIDNKYGRKLFEMLTGTERWIRIDIELGAFKNIRERDLTKFPPFISLSDNMCAFAIREMQAGVSSLDLSKNYLQNSHAVKIAEELKVNRTVTQLNLRESWACTDWPLTAVLKKNYTLTVLLGVDLTPDQSEALKENKEVAGAFKAAEVLTTEAFLIQELANIVGKFLAGWRFEKAQNHKNEEAQREQQVVREAKLGS